MLLKDLLDEFVLELEIQNYSPNTIKTYKGKNLNFINYLENKFQITNLEDVKTVNIKTYIVGLKQSKRKATYINSVIKTLQAFFKYAKGENLIKDNPISDVKLLKQNKPIINIFTEEEVNRMLNTFKGNRFLPIRDKAILCILIDTGVRCSELLNLKITDISDNHIVIREPKSRRDRIVAFSPYTKKFIARYIRCRESYFVNKTLDADSHLFLSYRCKRLTVEAIERIVKTASKKGDVRSEVRASPHSLRHYFSIQSLKNNLDIYSLSRILGHKNTNITRVYLENLKDEEIVEMSLKTSPLANKNLRK